tara:strand:- start:151 stop:849 length:699 start_codon:yes stop_codon:yes gene_type:complete
MVAKKQDTSLAAFLGGANLPEINAGMADALEADGAGMGGSAGGYDFLSLSGKTGVFKLGKDKDGIDPDELFVVDPRQNGKGWLCWKAGKVVARHAWSIYSDPATWVHENDLEDHGPYNYTKGDGWKVERTLKMLGIDSGRQISFSVGNDSGNRAFTDFGTLVSAEMRSGSKILLPIIKLSSRPFTAQDFLNYKPVLDVVGWTTQPAVEAFVRGALTRKQLLDGKGPRAKKAA